MTGKVYYLVGILLCLATLVATTVAYPQLPSAVPTHFNLQGEANGYTPKWALYLVGPGLMAAMLLFTWLLPKLSPKHFEMESFRSTYLQIMVMLVGMMAYIDATILWAGVGHSVNAAQATLAGVCLVFAMLGNVMGKVRRNFFIGVRTPWTLASERVWNATHRFAAKTFVVGGLAGAALIALGIDGWPPVTALLAGAFIPVFYSLYFYKQLERNGNL